MALTGSLTVAANLRYTPATLPELSSPSDQLARTLAITIADGSGAGQANQLWHDQRIVTASTNDDLDLAGSLTDVFGQTIALARVKALILQHKAGSNVLTVGGSPANPWISWLAASGDGVILRPNGGIIAAIAPDATGYVVTAGTGDILRVANGAGSSVTYDIYLVGANA